MPKLTDLIRQCEALGLAVEPPRRPAKAPYDRALREHYLKQTHPNGLPYVELQPMQLFNYWDLKESEQERLWTSHDWIIQPKLNGVRLALHFVPNVGVFAHGRRETTSRFRREDYSDYLAFRGFKPDFQATIDCEATLGAGTSHEAAALLHTTPEKALRIQQQVALTLHAFDIVSWQGEDLRKKHLAERLKYLDEFKAATDAAGLSKHFYSVPTTTQDKREFYDELLKAGAEGCVFKRLESFYHNDTSRDRRAWVKLKPQFELDAYVSGFEPGRPESKWHTKVATLLFAVKVARGTRLIAKVSSLPWAFRKEISQYNPATSELKLHPDLYGRVAHLKGYEISRNSLRLSHAAIQHWSKTAKPDECRYALQDLRQARWGGVYRIPKVLGK